MNSGSTVHSSACAIFQRTVPGAMASNATPWVSSATQATTTAMAATNAQRRGVFSAHSDSGHSAAMANTSAPMAHASSRSLAETCIKRRACPLPT